MAVSPMIGGLRKISTGLGSSLERSMKAPRRRIRLRVAAWSSAFPMLREVRKAAFSCLLSLSLLIVVGGGMPAAAWEPEVEAMATEIANSTKALMQPFIAERDRRKAANEPAVTASLTVLRSGEQPRDPSCAPALRTQFEQQVAMLSREIRRPVQILSPGTPATVTFVIGDIVGKHADPSEVPLEKWSAEAKRRSDQALTETSKNMDREAGKSILSGLYRRTDGALIHGSAVFDWDSSYIYADPSQPIWDCRFNFLKQIVWLYSLDLRERLRSQLLEIDALASQRSGANAIPDFYRSILVRTEIG
jgi:hypothetical protein